MNFQIVHVGSVGMDVGADGMSRPMNKIIAVPGFLDMPARGLVHFPSGDAASGVDCVEHRLHSGIARVAHNLKNLPHAARRHRAHESHPRYVVVHRTRRFLLAPDIKQNQVALANGHGMTGVRLVVRIARIRVGRHNRRIVGQQILAGKCLHEPLLNFVLLRAAVAHASADLLERRGHNGIDAVTRREVRLNLRFAPCGFELRHQIRRTHDVLAQTAQQVNRPAIHQRNGEDNIIRRILHRQIAIVRQDGLQRGE